MRSGCCSIHGSYTTSARRSRVSNPSPRNGAVTSALGRSATRLLRLLIDQVGTVLGVRGEPLAGTAHAFLVLLVDEPVDRSLEPLPRWLREVVPLLEMEPRAIGIDRLEADLARLVVARVPGDHRVRVAALGFDVGDQLERGPFSPERHLVDHASEPAVVVLVAGPEDVYAFDHGGVVAPAVVVLEQRPDARRRMRYLERVAVLPHGAPPGFRRCSLTIVSGSGARQKGRHAHSLRTGRRPHRP